MLFSALELDFFQIFLRHDADPNVILESEYALDRLIAIAADIPSVDVSERSYLQALETFIAHGAMLSQYDDSHVDAEGYYRGRQIHNRHQHPCLTFFKGMEVSMATRKTFFKSVLGIILPLA